MPIDNFLREMQSSLAVPDMRNMATTIRIVLFGIFGILIFPLVADYASYWATVNRTAAWVAPTILVNGLAGYVSSRYLIGHSYGVIINIAACLMQFLLVDYVILGERVQFTQHFVLYMLSLLFVMYMEANRKRQLSPAIAEARLTALTARIRPHFLFNSLNAAISLIRLRPYDAETLLENMANLFRAQLRDGAKCSTLGQEIEWAQEYIVIEQIRMGQNRVQVEWSHEAPDDAETPHLMLQPLLENAVFHGVESMHRPGKITVRTALKGHWLYIRIENPFSLKENADNPAGHKRKSNSMALRNLQERLSIMYDDDATIKLEPLEDEGIFRVDIRIPYRPKESAYQKLFGA